MITETATREAVAPSLVALLGEARATIVETLRRDPGRSVNELAGHLGISQVATRRHLVLLEEDGLIEAETVRQGRGRPAARYRLARAAGHLLPHRYDRFASEALEFLSNRDGQEGLRSFLRWRMQREVAGLGEVVTAEDLHERLAQLAGALSDAGFEASVDGHGDEFRLVQSHCAIEDVAREHPEVCAYEAASFAKVLGRDVTVSRRETLTAGSSACVCTIAPKTANDHRPNDVSGSADARASATNDHHDAGAQR